MTSSVKKDEPGRKRLLRMPSRRILRWGGVIVLLVGVALLFSWMLQRSLRTPARKRAMQSWLDENLNADVSLLGDMVVRVNLVRQSRLVFGNAEVEHPNPVFPGKFITVERFGAWLPPWSVARLWPGTMELLAQRMAMTLEENAEGEWNIDGLMQPLAISATPFPFPMPKIADWRARVENSRLTIRRRGFELGLDMNAEIGSQMDGRRVTVRTERLPFSFGPPGSENAMKGSAGPVLLSLTRREDVSGWLLPEPGRSETRVAGLPVSILPFFFSGIPVEESEGVFNGLVAYRAHPDADGAIVMEGELRNVPLSPFHLPRNVPLRLTWPVAPRRSGLKASLHMGPSGFGAFEVDIPLTRDGQPQLLSMQGDIASLDTFSPLFDRYSRWLDWLSLTFPTVEWRSGKWLGFGCSGENLRLKLVRSTAGLNLTGEAELMGGRVRAAMTPDKEDVPISVAAERVKPDRLAVMLSGMLPEPFQARLTGSHANFTWRGMRNAKGEVGDWGSGMVFAKPELDLAASGSWWRGLSGVVLAMVQVLPEWGGGDASELLDIAAAGKMTLDQLSIVAERADGALTVEFRAYGEALGQSAGVIHFVPGGVTEGEFLLAGPSLVIDAVERANPRFAMALDMLANDSFGLRVRFRIPPGGGPEFSYPFLDDAKRVRDSLIGGGGDAP